jgi:hypothetical protein
VLSVVKNIGIDDAWTMAQSFKPAEKLTTADATRCHDDDDDVTGIVVFG